jgi:hypothetical protein
VGPLARAVYLAGVLGLLRSHPRHRATTFSPQEDDLDRTQLQLPALWKRKKLVSRRLLAYDSTNFQTWVASTNTRNELAQRGHDKQGRHNPRQVSLSYVLDGQTGHWNSSRVRAVSAVAPGCSALSPCP